MGSGDDLDALLDEAFDSFEQEKQAEAVRQDERKKEKEKKDAEKEAAGEGGLPGDDQITELLEKALQELDVSQEGNDNLRGLVQEGLNIMKGGDEVNDNDPEILVRSANLLQSVMKEMGDDKNAFSPLLDKLSGTLRDLVSVVQSSEGGTPESLSDNDQEKLMDIIKRLGGGADGAEGSAGSGAAEENILKQLAGDKDISSLLGDDNFTQFFQEAMKAGFPNSNSSEEAEKSLPEDLMPKELAEQYKEAIASEDEKALEKVTEQFYEHFQKMMEGMEKAPQSNSSNTEETSQQQQQQQQTEETEESKPAELHADPTAEMPQKTDISQQEN